MRSAREWPESPDGSFAGPAGPTRTDTPLRAAGPEPAASANSATAGKLIDHFRALRGTPASKVAQVATLPVSTGETLIVDAEHLSVLSLVNWWVRRKRGVSYYAWSYRIAGRGSKHVTLSLHRVIAGALPGELVDHRSGDTLDNRRCNLRITTPRGNSANMHHSANRKRGGYKGVSWHKKAGKWMAHIGGGPVKTDGRRARVYLGLYDDPAEAARVYDQAASEVFGEFAALNFEVRDAG